MDYQSAVTEEKRTLRTQTALKFSAGDHRDIDPLSDHRVRRNVTIADLAQSMKQMAKLLEEERPAEAKRGMRRQLDITASRYPMALDKEVVRTRELAANYLENIDASFPDK